MATFTADDGTEIYFQRVGEGQPVVFSRGWPLSADAWEDQTKSMLICLRFAVAVLRPRRE